MSPRPTLAHVRRPAILAAAAQVISERGVIGTRISDVADRWELGEEVTVAWRPEHSRVLR